MPPLWPYLLLLPPAAVLTYEDFRTRSVSVVWLVALAATCLFVGGWLHGWLVMLTRSGINTVLTVLLIGLLALWQALRHPGARNLFAHGLGMGDAMLLLAVSPLFSPTVFLRFLIVSCLAALAWWGVSRSATIPLAGILSLTLAGYTAGKLFAVCP